MAPSRGNGKSERVGSIVRVPDDVAALGAAPDAKKPFRAASWGQQRWHLDRPVEWPDRLSEFDDVPRVFREHFLRGHLPAEPMLDRGDAVVTIGSCFADELRRVLRITGFGTGGFWVPAGLNNTFAILDFVSWCLTGEATPAGYSYRRGEDGTIGEWTPEAEQTFYRSSIEEAGAFVFTLGLAEVWSERDTNRVFWRGVPEQVFDEDRHAFRRSSVEENAANIVRIVELIRSVNESAPIVLTLSPISLRATFGGGSIMTADCVSKSTLRVAIDQALERSPAGVYYWPSFELVKWGGPVFDWRAVFPDSRHPLPYLTFCILDAFIEAFYGPEAAAEMRQTLKKADPIAYRRPRRRVDTARVRRIPRGLVRRVRGLLAR
ncbi:MAG TPA: GSCFA domain-containing protein [Gaiellaceae bacterium]|jgi:hypothetical protein|nr:GSCFA domain-containing protein [Gaiellaceae bacterium]